MFYIDKLKEQAAKIRSELAAAQAYIDSPEFTTNLEAQYGEGTDVYPSRVGYLVGSIISAKGDLAHLAWLVEQTQERAAWLDRCAALCEALSIDDDNIAALELLATDKRYRSECSDLRERITEAAGEIISDTRERERDDAVIALESAGFVAVERDDFEGWERTGETPGITERATVESKHRGGEYWYEFTLEVSGIESTRGKSGEFNKLLEAVGIKQEVKA